MNSMNISKNEKTKIFENIKSVYFLRKTFDIIKKTKCLNIIRYNKKLQKRLNISVNDYRAFCKIEIELKLYSYIYEGCKFINIPENEKEYYHIYFDDSEEEIKRNYFVQNEKVKTIKVIIDYQVISFEKLFKDCYSLFSISFKKFLRNNVSNMSGMFYNCQLQGLNLSSFNTKNVTDMSHMFSFCKRLKQLNISNFDTNKVNNMAYMFEGCSSLQEIYLSNFNTNNVTNISYMFSGYSSLKGLNLSNFNTKNVTNMLSMFSGCSSLKELNLSNFNTNII